MAEKKKVTLMLLKVDLDCSKCYKKVKKILCKFPQIQDQMYDEKNNTVMIKVVCCSPEKIRDKICCKGRGTIKSIEILKPPEKPPAPKPAEKPPAPAPAPKPAEKPQAPAPKPVEKPPAPAPKPAEKPPAPAPKPAEKPPAPAPKPAEKPPAPAPKPVEKPPAPAPAPKPIEKPPPPAPKPAEKPPPPAPKPAPAPTPLPAPAPVGFCCTECSEGRGGGPCYNPGYGQPVRYYDGYCGRPVYDSWGGGGYRGNYGSRCTEYLFNEDNSQGCTIM